MQIIELLKIIEKTYVDVKSAGVIIIYNAFGWDM